MYRGFRCICTLSLYSRTASIYKLADIFIKYWSMWFILRPIQNCSPGYIDLHCTCTYFRFYIYKYIRTSRCNCPTREHSSSTFGFMYLYLKCQLCYLRRKKSCMSKQYYSIILYMPWIDVIWTNNVQWMGDDNEYFGNHARYKSCNFMMPCVQSAAKIKSDQWLWLCIDV